MSFNKEFEDDTFKLIRYRSEHNHSFDVEKSEITYLKKVPFMFGLNNSKKFSYAKHKVKSEIRDIELRNE